MRKKYNLILSMYTLIVFIIIILVLVIFYFYNYTREDFTQYKRCDRKPVVGIMKTILDAFKVNKTIETNYDLYIPCGYNGVETELKNLTISDPEGKKIFGIDGCDSIVSKNSLWTSLKTCFGDKIASTIMPQTCVLQDPLDLKSFEKLYDSNAVYVLKKNLQRKQGIYLTRDLNEIKQAGDNNYKIVQQFIDSYVINKRKMNLRIYFLMVVLPNGEKKGYIHKLGKCLYTSKDVSDSDSSKNELVFEEHVTNSYTLEKSIYDNNPQSLQELEEYLSRYYKNPHILFKRMDKLFSQFFECIKYNLGNSLNLEETTRFQLFGADIIFDNTLTPYLLEVNKGPDMKYKDEKDKQMKTKVYLDVFEKSGLISIDDDPNYINGFKEIPRYTRYLF